MNIKILHIIIFFLLFCSVTSRLEAQDSVDFSLAQRLRTTSVDSLSIEEKVALILLPIGGKYEPNFNERRNSLKDPFIVSNHVLNVINGFEESVATIPFPDIRAICTLDDNRFRQILKVELLKSLSQRKERFILASNEYLFKKVGLSWKAPELSKYSFALWVLSGNSGEAIPIPAVNMPELLFEKNKPLENKSDSQKRNIFFSWGEEVSSSSPVSFEERISEGILFLTQDPLADYKMLVRAYRNNMLMEEDLNSGCKKILAILRKVNCDLTPVDSVPKHISELARRQSFEQGIRLFRKRDGGFLPPDLAKVKAGILSGVSEEATFSFKSMLNHHVSVEDYGEKGVNYVFWLVDGQKISEAAIEERLLDIHNNYPDARIAMIMANSGNYFEFHSIPDDLDALYTGTSDYPLVWNLLAQAVAGGLQIGYVKPCEDWFTAIRQDSRYISPTRLKFGIPEEVAMSSDSLTVIDSIMFEAIQAEATPGGQVLIARDGVVVWNRNYGYHTYDKKREVKFQHLYDLASVTKITATIPSLMKLYEKDFWAMDDSLGMFFPEADTTDKAGITLEELLLHEGGLSSYIPFYQNAIDRDQLNGSLFGRRYSWLYNIKLDDYIYMNRTVRYRKDVFQKSDNDEFSIQVARNFFMNKHFLDSITLQVIESPMRTRHRYLYSDLGFFFLGQMVPRLTGKSMDVFMDSVFYQPLGMQRTSFLPAGKFPAEEIVPTEMDKAFRKQLIHGWVHDPGAAMMGGVAGHAGLFSNAVDMAKMMQMYLNKGTYGGMRYLNESTIEYFTSCHSENNRRGLGFDKPEPDTAKASPASEYASPSSFGHSGFTGTLVWADPGNGLVYVFLSNRVHPYQYNKTLIEENIRTRIQDAAYKAIIKRE
ncbi:serine hydrolase [Marinilabilia sp.]|uniref:serine hydrolase domain-containing protein n=1 Tax=Marinilabilia sp. TaxID=2021252 RepID=UPI0025C4C1C7|nr:serine hydrolase [Marinilabilia sp.]